ncbi:hypothetical protein C0J52_24543 [Blattella germanica]|nr:hypothetical protein C0J52_24543 [Blattella germanica]
MPTPTAGAPLDEQEDAGDDRDLQPDTSQTARRKRKRKRSGEEEDSEVENAMSPEEEASASPPAAVIAGRDDDERRMLSPPSGSKFLHDEAVQAPMTRLDDEASSDDEDQRKKSEGNKSKTKERNPTSFMPDAGDDSCGTSDVEKFDGKIVYNPDGSAYIIEDSELSEEDTSLADLPQIIGDGCIVDGRGVSISQSFVFPQIANAFYVSRNPSLYNALYGGSAASFAANNVLQDKKIVPEVPIMHSYRVFTVRDNKSGDSDDGKADSGTERSASGNNEGDKSKSKQVLAQQQKKGEKYSGKDCSSVPVKPILMCFICKLSFGYAKSFVAHAMGDHNVALLEDEKDILGHKNASAIIQCVGKDKEPLVSFLEPLSPMNVAGEGKRESEMSMKKEEVIRTSPASSESARGECEDKNKASDDISDSAAESLVTHRRQSQDNNALSPTGRPNVQNPHVPETSVSLPQNGSSSSNIQSNRMIGVGINSVMDLTRKSPISASVASSGGNNGRNSVSPGASPSPGSTLSPLLSAAAVAAAAAASVATAGTTPTSLPYPQPPPNFLTGTTIGVCPDHMGGRPSGVECAKCELILSSSRLGGVGGPLAGMHSRNSCKTLKCPKCNWHYKYQETLEIHMKEKHPETETSCIYCIAGQPHPRLARGETYTCGYKPYRCEVCNYSTTTKGNLSIHMQSDKHLNNMQELQNGGVPSGESAITGPGLHSQAPNSGKGGLVSPGSGAGAGGAHHHPHHPHTPLSSGAVQSQKPKPTFRCDVCNYETNVARNLRIHMTSEKHTHNMMVLQQNVKHMHTLSALQQQQHPHQQQQQLSFETLLHFHPGLTLPGDKPPPHTEAALADMAYNQALLIQMMTGGQLPPHIPPELAPHMDMGLNPETMEPPPEPADPNPSHLFHCCVCNVFSTDSLEALSHHLSADRTKIREQEILAVVAGHYVCKLCTYKTNLKANFQLHCKTDKHLQRLQHVNHVKEGGPRNEWKLKYVSSPGGIQVRCHACDYYTNSAHKLQLHAAGQRHEASCLLFMHLRESEAVCEAPRIYHCALCGFSSRAKLQLLQHVRSMKHLQMEQLHQLQRRSEGKELQTDIGEVFQVISQLEPPAFGESEQGKSATHLWLLL